MLHSRLSPDAGRVLSVVPLWSTAGAGDVEATAARDEEGATRCGEGTAHAKEGAIASIEERTTRQGRKTDLQWGRSRPRYGRDKRFVWKRALCVGGRYDARRTKRRVRRRDLYGAGTKQGGELEGRGWLPSDHGGVACEE